MAGAVEVLGSSSGSDEEVVVRIDCDCCQESLEKSGEVPNRCAGSGLISRTPCQAEKIPCHHQVADAMKSSPRLRRSYKRLKNRAQVGEH
jgi:hypothetical protein